MKLKICDIVQQRQNREFGDSLKINLESYLLLNQLISLSSPVLSLLNGRDTIIFQAMASVPQGEVGNWIWELRIWFSQRHQISWVTVHCIRDKHSSFFNFGYRLQSMTYQEQLLAVTLIYWPTLWDEEFITGDYWYVLSYRQANSTTINTYFCSGGSFWLKLHGLLLLWLNAICKK